MRGDYKMDTTKMWDYRVVRKESKDGSAGWYSIQEIYYDDETGEPMAQTIDLQVEQDTITGMRTQLENMLKALDEPVLDESDIINNEEDKWICEICGKSTYDVEDDYIGSGTNHLGCELEIEMNEKDDKTLYEDMGGGHLVKADKKIKEDMKNLRKVMKVNSDKWIYESPDGGKTVFRRPFADYNLESKEEINWDTKEPTGRLFKDWPFKDKVERGL